ncbi:MAG TPA: DNRLRE domain-containing protein [Candidatus Krumholzibacteria bacterium]|nr:DNRLRE domain-containing protein [Candidatus Krumholzibacteria bacterium]
MRFLRIITALALVSAGVLAACSSQQAPPIADGTPPGRVTDLTVKRAITNVVTLRWTTPGDNGALGVATTYRIRWSPNIITQDNFPDAFAIPDPPIPGTPGTIQVFSVPNMDITQVIHFAMSTMDEVGNVSPVSNDAVWAPGNLPIQYYTDLPAARDNTMYKESDNVSNGAGEYFFAGRTDSTSLGLTRRALLAFSVADSVPAGAHIDSVRLTLHMSKTPAGKRNVALHAALADWGEGIADAPGNEEVGAAATGNDATWKYRLFNTAAWTAPGGDFDSTASAQLVVNGIGVPTFYTWRSPQMNVEVQHWLDVPDSNFGWVVVGSESDVRSVKRFDSRENPNAAYHPRLTIYYTVSP